MTLSSPSSASTWLSSLVVWVKMHVQFHHPSNRYRLSHFSFLFLLIIICTYLRFKNWITTTSKFKLSTCLQQNNKSIYFLCYNLHSYGKINTYAYVNLVSNFREKMTSLGIHKDNSKNAFNFFLSSYLH